VIAKYYICEGCCCKLHKCINDEWVYWFNTTEWGAESFDIKHHLTGWKYTPKPHGPKKKVSEEEAFEWIMTHP